MKQASSRPVIRTPRRPAPILREGGNAVDAAVAAVLASFAVESPLTGFGAGGFMMVHEPSAERALIDFFVPAPGLDGIERSSELVPVDSISTQTAQTFYVGPASCGVPGTAAGLDHALARFGSVPLAELIRPGVRLARDGVPVNAEQAYIFDMLDPILARLEESRELYAPAAGRWARATVPLPRARRRAGALWRGRAGALLSRRCRRGDRASSCRAGRDAGPDDMAAYEAIERRPIQWVSAEPTSSPTRLRPRVDPDRLCLGLLERMGESRGPEQTVAAMGAAQESRGEDFAEALHGEGWRRLPRPGRARPRGGGPARLDHPISVLDAEGICASVTCSNGSGSESWSPGPG